MPKTINIVVVEDNLALQDLMVDHLLKGGYSVRGVSDAEELAEVMAEERVDILLLDINLPGEDGLSIASRLRKVNPHLYIVMMTARTSEKTRRSAMKVAQIFISLSPHRRVKCLRLFPVSIEGLRCKRRKTHKWSWMFKKCS